MGIDGNPGEYQPHGLIGETHLFHFLLFTVSYLSLHLVPLPIADRCTDSGSLHRRYACLATRGWMDVGTRL